MSNAPNSTAAPAGNDAQAMSGVPGDPGAPREFFVGQYIKTDLLVSWLEQHGISATSEFVDPTRPDDGDLSREVRVLVAAADYPRAHQLFFTEREDEL
jgi:hypothetical protein